MSRYKRGTGTYIYNRFKYWSVEDCACENCVNYTKDKPCPLNKCCIEDIKQEAIQRETANLQNCTN